MHKAISISALGAIFALSSACSGKEEDPSTTNPQVAVQAISALGSFEDAQTTGDGAAAASGVISLGNIAGSIIVPADPNAMTPSAVPQSASAVTGTCTCTQTSCTFDQCGDENGTWTIDGTIGRDGDTYSVDLSIDLDQAGFTWSWNYQGTITITDTLIDGSLRASGNGSYSDEDVDISASWSWAMDFQEVVRDASGCPVGGSMHAEIDLTASGNGQRASFYATGDVAFGPTCGEAEAI